jgi:hypothetical protein
MSLATFLVGLVGPVMARWLASMGLSLISMAGLAVAVTTLRSTLISSVNSMPGDGVQLAGLLGIWYCLGMILGAVTFVITWHSTKGMWTLGKA